MNMINCMESLKTIEKELTKDIKLTDENLSKFTFNHVINIF